MAKLSLYTRKDRIKGLRVLLDDVINKRNLLNKQINKETSTMYRRRLSPAVRDILNDYPIIYKRR